MSGFGRRGLLLAGVGVLAGCSASSGGQASGTSVPSGTGSSAGTPSTPSPSGPSSSTPTSSTPTPSGPSSSAPSSAPASGTPREIVLPRVRSWAPGPGEIEPAAKRAAVAAVVALVRPRDTRGVVEVIDAQYGGILSDTASVLVPCRVFTLADSQVATGGTTVDVRLTKTRGTWRVTAMHPAQPGKATTQLSPAARQVLNNARIALPPASAADIRSGQVHQSVLAAMLELAQTYRIGVSVIRSGHPINVFGTDRPSDHPRGRAFDTWQIDGRAVVDPGTPRSLVTAYMRATEALGSYNVGGPYQLSGPAYFSDRTHHDHIHAGFRA